METAPHAPHLPALPASPPTDYDQALARLPAFAPAAAPLTPAAREYLAAGRDFIRALHDEGENAHTVVRLSSELMDRLLRGLYARLAAEASKLPPVALAALGGYGRRELNPRSDIDVFLLHEGPGEPKPAVRELAEKLLYVLWDLKLEVGWGVRTAKECARLAADDHTARTALVDCRFVAGSEAVYAALEDAVLRDLVHKHADEFIHDKLAELKARRLKYGDTVFVLEPNVKNGEGGLRDLQAALWMATARFGAKGISDLLHRAILPPREVEQLHTARDFMWRVRNAMHYSTGRKEDRLTFDLQLQIADALGYRESPEGLPVEQFMRHYYLAASAIKRAADALAGRCEETTPRHKRPPQERKLDGEFKILNGKLTLNDPELFAKRPAAIARLFAVADREGLPLFSVARDGVTHELHRIDDAVRASPEVNVTLRQMFARPGTRGEFLQQLHELGALGALIPEFDRLTARHVHDLYHVYTVDVHSIRATMRLYALRNGELAEQEPELTRLMQSLARPLPLYLGMLFHDVGKGGGSNHSERGAKLVAQVCERLQLSGRDAADVEFLVRHHLRMSHVSQKRDLSDPHLIADYAREVGDRDRNLMLYLLTYADMCSVAPNTWNDWRARLLHELFDKARAVLEDGEKAGEPLFDRAALLGELAAAFGEDEAERFLASMPERYVRSVHPRDAVRHLRVLRRGRARPLAAWLVHKQTHTELTLTSADRPGLLSVYTGVLAAHGIDIMRAQIFSTSEGRTLDVFTVRAAREGTVGRERWRKARADLLAALTGKLDVEALLARRGRSGLAAKVAPKVKTHVAVDNASARDATVIDVYTEDRLGVLHTISRTLFEHGVTIALAKVATEANRVTDGFYVQKDGRKIEDPALLERLKQALEAALAT